MTATHSLGAMSMSRDDANALHYSWRNVDRQKVCQDTSSSVTNAACKHVYAQVVDDIDIAYIRPSFKRKRSHRIAMETHASSKFCFTLRIKRLTKISHLLRFFMATKVPINRSRLGE